MGFLRKSAGSTNGDNRLAATVRVRVRAYAVVFVGLLAAYPVLNQMQWHGSTELHTLMEVVATLLALMIGSVALVRYFTKQDNAHLFIGVGFFGAALLDGYHSVVTSSFFHQVFPSSPPSLIPWSWNASRTFLSILMVLSVWAWRRENRRGEAGRISDKSIYGGVAALAIATFVLFALVPLPRAYFPELIFGRPQEFVPAVFFFVAFVGYLHKGAWKHDAFEHWIVISLIVGFVGQAAFMSRSYELFDCMFDVAHLLKKVSYGCVLVGLLINIHELYGVAERRQLGERFQSLLECAPDSIVVVNPGGRIILVNAQTEQLFGYERSELIGQPIEMLMPERSRASHPPHVAEYFAKPTARPMVTSGELYAQHSSGREFPVEISLSPLHTKDGLIVSSSIRDVSEQRDARRAMKETAQKLEASNAELENFAYVASHDLQEPLRMVTSFLQLLEQDYAEQLDDEAKEYIDFAVDGAMRMKRLINDLLLYSRVGTQGLPIDTVDCEQVLANVLLNLTAAILETDAKVDHEPLPAIRADASQIGQVLQNLIGNAIKFHGDRTPEVSIKAVASGDEWLFSVRDNGIGIAPEFLERIFIIFQRLHSTQEYPGTGIGLAVCKKIVERHGGRIWIESESGQGSTFYFTFPRMKQEKADDGQFERESNRDSVGRGQSGGRPADAAGAERREGREQLECCR